MKKFFAILGCVLGFALICVIAYFVPGSPDNIEVPLGKYGLIKIVEEKDGEEKVEDFDISLGTDDFLQVYKNKKLKTFSSKGFIKDDKIYSYTVRGTSLTLYLDDEEFSKSFFVDDVIIICIEKEENDVLFKGNYYFQFME